MSVPYVNETESDCECEGAKVERVDCDWLTLVGICECIFFCRCCYAFRVFHNFSFILINTLHCRTPYNLDDTCAYINGVCACKIISQIWLQNVTFLHLVALDRDGMINESLLFYSE